MPRHTIPALLLLAAVTLLLAPAAGAQDFALFGSYWQTEDLESTAGAGAKLTFGGGLLGLELRATYYPDLTEDADALFDLDSLDELEFEVEALPVDLGLHLGLGNLFLSGGVTWFRLDSNVLELDDEVGVYAGAGIELGGGNVGFVAEALYRQVEGSVDGELGDVDSPGDLGDLVVDDVELDLGGLVVNAGVVFRL